jgi:hypothetical protein
MSLRIEPSLFVRRPAAQHQSRPAEVVIPIQPDGKGALAHGFDPDPAVSWFRRPTLLRARGECRQIGLAMIGDSSSTLA